MTKITVSGIQMDITPKDADTNLKRALDMIDQATLKNSQIVCLPELFTTGFYYEYIKKCATKIPNTVTDALCEKAMSSKIYIIAGSIPEKVGKKIYNTSAFIGRDGKIIGKYRKVHLFPLMGEDKNFCSGTDIRIFETDFGPMGVVICYDLRFPDIFRKIALMGAKVIFVPSEFPNPKIDHWKTLLKARAIENQLYVFGVNTIGRDESSTFFGNSMVCDPLGVVMAESDDKADIITVDIDLSKIDYVRRRVFYLENCAQGF